MPVETAGDCYARYRVRMVEFRESIKIVRQALDGLPEGPISSRPGVKSVGQVRIPKGEAYARVEGARGEVGCYLIADGSAKPYRMKWRGASFSNLSVLPHILIGCKVADVVAVRGVRRPGVRRGRPMSAIRDGRGRRGSASARARALRVEHTPSPQPSRLRGRGSRTDPFSLGNGKGRGEGAGGGAASRRVRPRRRRSRLMPPALYAVIVGFVVLNAIIGLVTYVTLLERKFAARMQSRIGPYRVGPHGLLQPIADALKLMMKEDVIPRQADRPVYNLAPIVFLVPCMLIFATMPWAPGLGIADLNIGILFFLAVSAMEIVGLFMGGWGSNNKYALLSPRCGRSTRSSPTTCRSSSSLSCPSCSPGRSSSPTSRRPRPASRLVRLLSRSAPSRSSSTSSTTLAAENRVPFDILEAESELIAGFRVEYSGMKFALIQLGEYAHIIGTSFLGALLFLGAWAGPGPAWLGPVLVPSQGDVRLSPGDVDPLELRPDPRGPDPRHLVEAPPPGEPGPPDGHRPRGRAPRSVGA